MDKKYQSLPDVQIEDVKRVLIQQESFDGILGGGFYPGEAILLAGEPGSGKSTLLLQVAARLAMQGKKILYVAGEENSSQVASRAKRLSALYKNIYIAEETMVEKLYDIDKELDADFIIIDSLQTLQSNSLLKLPGNSTVMRYCLASLIGYTKAHGKNLITIGHSTKTGLIAGLLTLQHMVDAVFFMSNMDGERWLMSKKNRFGPAQTSIELHMTEDGFTELSGEIQKTRGLQGFTIWELPIVILIFIGALTKAIITFIVVFFWTFFSELFKGDKQKHKIAKRG